MSGTHNFILQIVKSTLVSLVYGSVLVLVTTKSAGRLVERILSTRAMRSIGRYSYGMYVIHPFLLGWLKSLGVTVGKEDFVHPKRQTEISSGLKVAVHRVTTKTSVQRQTIGYTTIHKSDTAMSDALSTGLTGKRGVPSMGDGAG